MPQPGRAALHCAAVPSRKIGRPQMGTWQFSRAKVPPPQRCSARPPTRPLSDARAKGASRGNNAPCRAQPCYLLHALLAQPTTIARAEPTGALSQPVSEPSALSLTCLHDTRSHACCSSAGSREPGSRKQATHEPRSLRCHCWGVHKLVSCPLIRPAATGAMYPRSDATGA
jgi:hypothetical protein